MSVMTEAVLLDLVHGCCPSCTGAALQEDSVSHRRQVFLLRGKNHLNPDSLSHLSACTAGSACVLDSESTVESLIRFKETVDQQDLSSIRVLTSPRGREVLQVYQDLLFTAVYTFRYSLIHHTCEDCTSPAPAASPADVEEEVSKFLQKVPGLRGDLRVLRSSLIPDSFGHGFSTRGGGVSSISTMSSLNLFSSSRRRDSRAVVTENRRRLAVHAGFPAQQLRLVQVNHANDVWVLGKEEPQSYDAMVTNRTDVVLAAPGADCMPILFADPVSKVIGVAHSGWRGTLMGVAMVTVEAMVTEFGCRASDILVAVGPSVGSCCFSLQREQALDFYNIHPDCVPDPESETPHVNIRLANRLLLQRGGVLPENIHDDTVTERPSVTPCTSCHPELFFSHRRDGKEFGTQVGYLWIRETPPPNTR
ncbi:laccase domain-containing protein 1 [Xyrichtys novacula]|uniref:Purine nucleoside phosphorylase LACC1 n=1 Tax=Xyrichtys novacula TaxID=13765 RepID=A0AAV1GYB4_XYRNO|nr:laccase domain-containing protein 1 [Xyrichtys novacula]